MPVLFVILVLVAVGAVLMAINNYGAGYIHPWWLKLINLVAIVGTLWWLLVVSGLWNYLWTIKVPAG